MNVDGKMNHLQEAEIKFECINLCLDFVIGDDVLMQTCFHFYFKPLYVITIIILMENKNKTVSVISLQDIILESSKRKMKYKKDKNENILLH